MNEELSPQRKKQLSLARDCRNWRGNSNASARNGVRRFRAHKQRRYRRRLRQALGGCTAYSPEALEQIDAAVAIVRRDHWVKESDMPLGEWIERAEFQRARRAGRKPARDARDAMVPMEVLLLRAAGRVE